MQPITHRAQIFIWHSVRKKRFQGKNIENHSSFFFYEFSYAIDLFIKRFNSIYIREYNKVPEFNVLCRNSILKKWKHFYSVLSFESPWKMFRKNLDWKNESWIANEPVQNFSRKNSHTPFTMIVKYYSDKSNWILLIKPEIDVNIAQLYLEWYFLLGTKPQALPASSISWEYL